MDNTKFIALMSDNNADFNIIVSKDNLKAFADHLISHFRLELEAKAEQTRTATVTVFIPPAVPTGEPPMIIRTTDTVAAAFVRFS